MTEKPDESPVISLAKYIRSKAVKTLQDAGCEPAEVFNDKPGDEEVSVAEAKIALKKADHIAQREKKTEEAWERYLEDTARELRALDVLVFFWMRAKARRHDLELAERTAAVQQGLKEICMLVLNAATEGHTPMSDDTKTFLISTCCKTLFNFIQRTPLPKRETPPDGGPWESLVLFWMERVADSKYDEGLLLDAYARNWVTAFWGYFVSKSQEEAGPEALDLINRWAVTALRQKKRLEIRLKMLSKLAL